MGTGHTGTPSGGHGTPASITDVRPLLELLETAALSETYTCLAREPMTVPEIVAAVGMSKSTAYAYIEKLVAAGLATPVEDDTEGATVYEGREFELLVTIDDEELRLTPDLVRVISHRESNDTIDRFIDQYGVATLAAVIEVAPEHAAGDLTSRMVAAELDIPRGWAFDVLEAVTPLVVEDLPAAETFGPEDIGDDERAALLGDESDATK